MRRENSPLSVMRSSLKDGDNMARVIENVVAAIEGK
jgi:hypothetical protein